MLAFDMVESLEDVDDWNFDEGGIEFEDDEVG
jgi:hypothetical protein